MEDTILASSESDSSGSIICSSSFSSSGGLGGSSGEDSGASGSTSRSRRSGRTRRPTLALPETMRWRRCWMRAQKAATRRRGAEIAGKPTSGLPAAVAAGTVSQSNNLLLATSDEVDATELAACGSVSQGNNQLLGTSEEAEAEAAAAARVGQVVKGETEEEEKEEEELKDRDSGVTRVIHRLRTPDTNASADESALPQDSQLSPEAAEGEKVVDSEPALVTNSEEPLVQQESSESADQVFANLGDGGSQAQTAPATKSQDTEHPRSAKSELANVIEKAILDFCSSRTVETMRRMFAGATSEMEALQGEGARAGGDKSAQAPHPVTGELVKEGIVIGTMDVFAPRVHREYRLEMRDDLVEGFLKDAGVFRAICYRTKCQLEVTRRLLNKKLCTGGRWVKYLIVRIVGPSLRAIGCCDQLLQKAVPAFKNRFTYPKAAFCRLFFREDIPDNAMLYSNFQRTGGTSNRYGALRLETPYRATSERTVGNCPWKSGSLRVGKLSFTGAGSHLCMKQVYPSYGYGASTAVESACQGVEAVHRIEQMHQQCITRRQALVQDRRVMTIPVCR